MTYSTLLLAAAHLLARWQLLGSRSVLLTSGRVDPMQTPPEPGTWPIDTPDAARVLAATVLLGARYRHWADMLAIARSEMGWRA